jgi:hypothetical protein
MRARRAFLVAEDGGPGRVYERCAETLLLVGLANLPITKSRHFNSLMIHFDFHHFSKAGMI